MTIHSADTHPELSPWLRWASDSANAPMFVRRVAEAALIACSPDYVLLRPDLIGLKKRYLRADPALPDEPE